MAEDRKRNQGELKPLHELDDFEVHENDPDVRNWDVIGGDGTRIGKVDELIVDPDAMKVRYLNVDVSDNLEIKGEDKQLLIPIGMAALDEDKNNVFVDALNRDMISTYPRYTGGPINKKYEIEIQNKLHPGRTANKGSFYEHPSYDQSKFYGRRREKR